MDTRKTYEQFQIVTQED